MGMPNGSMDQLNLVVTLRTLSRKKWVGDENANLLKRIAFRSDGL